MKDRRELNDEEWIKLMDERLEELKNNPDSTVELKEVLEKIRIKYGFDRDKISKKGNRKV